MQNDTLALAQTLIACRSLTPFDEGCQEILINRLEKIGFNATVLFNQIGERIYLVGDLSSGAGSPDIYEAPRSLLDFQIAQKIMKKKGEIRINVSDILNKTQYFYQNANDNTKLQKGEDAYRFTRKFGTTFGILFNYTL